MLTALIQHLTAILQYPFIQGIVVGFAVCIPVGPIAILIMRRTVVEGRVAGFISGLGAATADALVGAIGALFLSFILPYLDSHNTAVQFVGGGIVISMGIFLLSTPPKIKEVNRPLHERNLRIACLSTCLLTLSNPLTLLSMTTLLAATGLGGRDTDYIRAAVMVSGIFTASTIWWLFICTCADWLARKLGNGFLRVLNLVAAILVIIFGVGMVVHQAQKKLYDYQHHIHRQTTSPAPPPDMDAE